MAKTFFSRTDIEALADRMDARAWSPMFADMPETKRDLRSSASILRWLVGQGYPVTHLELDIWNGSI